MFVQTDLFSSGALHIVVTTFWSTCDVKSTGTLVLKVMCCTLKYYV